MPSFLERYKDGDRVGVWNDLVELGEGVRHEFYYADAVAVATETMRRARHNVDLLIPRLVEMGYRFVPPGDEYTLDLDSAFEQMSRMPGALGFEKSPIMEQAMDRAREQVKERMGPLLPVLAADKAGKAAKVAKKLEKSPLENPEVFDPPGRNTQAQLKKMEKKAGGLLPISLCAWFEQVGGVNLMGSHPVINPKNHEWAADPLVVERLDNLLSLTDSEGEDGETEIALWISPDDLHKANTSGGDPYTIMIPNACADVALQWESHNTTFVNYLRIAFEWGGFPGWESYHTPPRAEIAKLAEGLLPL